MARKLDFLVIGAARAGTTSLHEYLRTHPELFLPAVKEQPFFTNDQAYMGGWDEYVEYAFAGGPPDCRWGKVTPQYLGGPVRWSRETIERARRGGAARIIASRVAEAMPEVKLITLLRQPVARAVSHQRLSALRGTDRRPLEEALRSCLKPEALHDARSLPKESNCYVVAGEYGRLLSSWLEEFPRERLLVASSHELSRDPHAVLNSIWAFLGVGPHIPPNLDRRYNPTAARRRVPALDFRRLPRRVRAIPGVRTVWDALPVGRRNRIRARYQAAIYRLQLWNRVTGPVATGGPPPELMDALAEHYRPDLNRLAELVGPVPGVTQSAPDEDPPSPGSSPAG